MISLTFESFMNQRYNAKQADYQLYVVRDDRQVYYVGISKRGVWSRWFGNRGRMQQNAGGYWVSTDSISREIVEHWPQSLNYMIDLYTLADCQSFMAGKVDDPRFFSDRCRIDDLEPVMIDLLRPSLNGTYNTYRR